MPAPTKPQPPPGGDVDIGWKLEVGTTVTFLAAAIVVALRCFARWRYSQRGWDDYLMVFALAQALAATIIDFVATDHGLGRHYFYLSPQHRIDQQYYSILAQVFCVEAISFAKLSIVASYMRVLQGSANKVHRALLWTTAILTLAVNTVVVVTFYTACNPIAKTWDPMLPGSCWSIDKKLAFFILQGAFSAFSDFFLAVYPVIFLSKLQIERKRKALVLGLMALGVVTGVFAVIRTVETGTQLHPPPGLLPDASYSTVLGLTWSGMERNIAIMVGSVPALNPLWAPAARFIRETVGSSRSKLRSARSQSYQLSDVRKSDKLASDGPSQQQQEMGRDQHPSSRMTDASEDFMLPVHGREVA